MKPVVILLLSAHFSTVWAGETVHRCVDAQGNVQFQQQACADGGGALTVDGGSSGLGGLRAGETKWLKQRERQAREEQSRRNSSAADEGAKEARNRRCRKMRRRLERINGTLRRGYSRAEGERLRQRRRDLESDLRSDCP